MAVDVGSAVGYLDLDISGFLAGLKSAQSEADKQTKNIATTIGNNISSIGTSLTSVGTTLTKNVTVPLTAVGVAGLKVATDFEKGMSEVKAISGATGKDFDALREKAIELGADTAFSAGEVAAAMTEMAKAGWSSQQIIDGMNGVLSAAAASGEGLATVSTIVADAITGFGLEASDSVRVADLLTQAANSGTIGITDLGESFKYIAPVASTMGLSIEDVTTAISAMSMAGIKGSQAGTSLRTMLTRMIKPTDAVEAAMTDLGIVLTNEDGTFKSLDTIVSEMRGTFNGLTDEQKTYYATVLAGQEGMSGLLSLLNLTQEEYDAIGKSMDDSKGVAETTAAVMQDNLQSKVEQLGGALESLAIKLADHVIPHIQKFVLWLTNLVDKFAALDPETQKTILKFGALAAAAGPVLVVLGKLISGVGGFITTLGKIPGAISKVKTGFTALTNSLKNVGEGFKLAKAGYSGLAASAGGAGTKIGAAMAGISASALAVVAVIAVLVAAFVSLWKNNEDFRNKIIAIWDQIKATFEKLTSGIVERLNRLGFDFENIGEVISAIWKGLCDFLAPYFEGVFNYISIAFETFVNVFLGIWDFFHALFTGDWQGCWDAIKGIFESIWNGIKDWFMNILNVLKGTFDVVLGWFGTSWTECWEGIKTFFVSLWEGISTWFQNTITAIATFFTNTWTSIATFFTDLWNGITSFFSTAWETIKNVVQVGIMFIVELIKAWFNLVTLPFRFIWENCKETIIAVWDAIKEFISNALNAIKTTITNVWNAVSSFFTSIWTSISTFVSSIWNTIKTTISSVLDAIKTAITNAFNAVKTTVTNIWNSISTFFSNIWNAIKTTITNAVNAVKTTISNVFDTIKTTVTNVFNAIKNTATNIWNGIKDAISGPINSAKATVSSVVDSIKSAFTNGFNAAKSTVSNVFNSIKSSISNVMDGARNTIKGAIDKIKGFFNFSWSLPKLKMPHFSIKGSFSLNPPSVPYLSIDWYKKAMGDGMIMNSPTIFGFNQKTGQFMAGGEAGSETVVGTKSLLNMIKQAVADAVGPLVEVSRELARTTVDLGYVTYNGFTKLKEIKQAKDEARRNGGGEGDTFVFYSPKPIDEIEAAKQVKKTKRELAEGF